eukprot:151172_1
MSDWSLNIQSSATPYSFWSFGRYGYYGASNGRNTTNISDATLGVYQTHPLSFKATEDGLIIEGADKPSKQIIEWKVNNKGRFKVFTANIIQAENGNKTIIELVYSDSKYTFELKKHGNEQKNTIHYNHGFGFNHQREFEYGYVI